MTKSSLFLTRNDLPLEIREKIVTLLNQHLADTFDLYSQTKQAHWNVKGPQFFQMHELFDKLAEEVEDLVDMIAERATSLGGIAQGTARKEPPARPLLLRACPITLPRQSRAHSILRQWSCVLPHWRLRLGPRSIPQAISAMPARPTSSLKFPEHWTKPCGSLKATHTGDSTAS